MMTASITNGYDQDFYSWTRHNAERLRQGKFAEVDIENVAEEIESLGKRDKRELAIRLAVLMAHLLKWRFQPEKRSNSWRYPIKEQRIQIRNLLEESPSLKHELGLKMAQAYEEAVILAESETGIYQGDFPRRSPFSFVECLDEDFFPRD